MDNPAISRSGLATSYLVAIDVNSCVRGPADRVDSMVGPQQHMWASGRLGGRSARSAIWGRAGIDNPWFTTPFGLTTELPSR